MSSAIFTRATQEVPEYGRGGQFGILTPQGNPTVEPEMRVLLPVDARILVARLVSKSGTLRERLIEYSRKVGEFVGQFDALKFDAVGFACTGSSYLVDADKERRRIDAVERQRSCAVITAADAVKSALRHIGVQAVALISPYPDWLTAASRAHWIRAGLRVTTVVQLPSGSASAHGIYGLTTEAVLTQLAELELNGADAILITGTGMPSLRTILALEPEYQVPVLSSNLCLAWALAKTVGNTSHGPESRLFGGWAKRLER